MMRALWIPEGPDIYDIPCKPNENRNEKNCAFWLPYESWNNKVDNIQNPKPPKTNPNKKLPPGRPASFNYILFGKCNGHTCAKYGGLYKSSITDTMRKPQGGTKKKGPVILQGKFAPANMMTHLSTCDWDLYKDILYVVYICVLVVYICVLVVYICVLVVYICVSVVYICVQVVYICGRLFIYLCVGCLYLCVGWVYVCVSCLDCCVSCMCTTSHCSCL